jgi:hypothetical protein
VLSLLDNGKLNVHGYLRPSNNTGWLHDDQEWKATTMGWAVLSIGAAGCYIGKTQHETSQYLVDREFGQELYSQTY